LTDALAAGRRKAAAKLSPRDTSAATVLAAGRHAASETVTGRHLGVTRADRATGYDDNVSL
jgi:hypothetical protein